MFPRSSLELSVPSLNCFLFLCPVHTQCLNYRINIPQFHHIFKIPPNSEEGSLKLLPHIIVSEPLIQPTLLNTVTVFVLLK